MEQSVPSLNTIACNTNTDLFLKGILQEKDLKRLPMELQEEIQENVEKEWGNIVDKLSNDAIQKIHSHKNVMYIEPLSCKHCFQYTYFENGTWVKEINPNRAKLQFLLLSKNILPPFIVDLSSAQGSILRAEQDLKKLLSRIVLSQTTPYVLDEKEKKYLKQISNKSLQTYLFQELTKEEKKEPFYKKLLKKVAKK